MRIVACVLAALLVLGGLAGCGSTDEGETGFAVQDPDLVATGSALFAEACSSCHAPDLRGTERGPSLLSSVYAPGHHADGAFLLAVRRGVPAHHWSLGAMPPVEGLTDADVEAIVAFVRERQRVEGFEPYPP